MSFSEVVTLGLLVINKLYPVAKDIYEAVNDPDQPEIQADKATELIKEKAREKGLSIGHTEAELVRSAIHFARAKSKRHTNFVNREE